MWLILYIKLFKFRKINFNFLEKKVLCVDYLIGFIDYLDLENKFRKNEFDR